MAVNPLAIFSTKPAEQAAQAQQDAINKGYSGLSDLMTQGRGALTTNYQAGLAPVTQNIQNAQAGTGQLMNLLGIGPQGSAGVQAALAATPGYQFQLDQGNQNILRNRAATGALNSGGTNLDLLKFGQGLAGTTYQNAVGNLQPFLTASQTAAGQGLQGYGALGQGLAGSLGEQGQAFYGAQTGIGNAQANADLSQYSASKNLLDAGMQLAQLGVGAATGGMGGKGGSGGGGAGIFSPGGMFGSGAGGGFAPGGAFGQGGTISNLFGWGQQPQMTSIPQLSAGGMAVG